MLLKSDHTCRSSEQMACVENWLHVCMRHCKCQCCNASKWGIGEIVVLQTDDWGNEMVGQQPSVLRVVCQHCANVLFFDLDLLEQWQMHEEPHSTAVSHSLDFWHACGHSGAHRRAL